jgi:hypothetical protein
VRGYLGVFYETQVWKRKWTVLMKCSWYKVEMQLFLIEIRQISVNF